MNKILVVDDEIDLQHLIRQKFRKQIKSGQWQFLFAGNGAEAMATLINEPDVQIIVTDINMPIMDGLTLLSKVKILYPYTKTIIMSAYGDMQNIRAGMNAGAFDFLTKPVDLKDLEVTIGKTLQYVQQEKEAQEEKQRLREKVEAGDRLDAYHKLKSRLSPTIQEELDLSSEGEVEYINKRNLVTFLCTEVTGFSLLQEKSLEGQTAGVLQKYLQEMLRIIEFFKPNQSQLIGNSITAFFGLFGNVNATEQARQVVAMAASIHKSIDRICLWLSANYDFSVQIRTAIHQDSALVGTYSIQGQTKHAVVGSGTALLKPMLSDCSPDSILVSFPIYCLTKDDYHYEKPQQRKYQELDLSIETYQLLPSNVPDIKIIDSKATKFGKRQIKLKINKPKDG